MFERNTLQIGDRVRLMHPTMTQNAGAEGVVTCKYAPAQRTATWVVTVRFDGRHFSNRFSYPAPELVRIG
jgi:hypothetical protein